MDYHKIYTNAFSDNNYSKEHHVQYDWVIELLKKKYSMQDKFTLIDIGSGRGHMLKLIHNNFPNAVITSVDLDNFHNLDFLEHIEEKYIDDILTTFHDLSPYCIIAVANHSDIQNGIQLHLIQNNNYWWTSKLNGKFNITHYRDNGENSLYMYEVNSK